MTRLLERGRVAEALAAYAGPLLPASDAPGVARLRRLIDGQLRAAVLAGRDRGLLQTWVRAPWGADDLEMWEAYAAGCSRPARRRRPLATGRIAQLAAEYGLATSVQRPRN